MHENLNKELYSNKLFKVWVDKYNLIPLEEYFLKKYLLNKNGKVIEAGTGGGRLIFEIEKLGFKKLDAFDYVNNMINFCKEKKKQLKSRVNFKVAEVNDLSYYNSLDFDYLIYLQQVLCFIDKEDLPKAFSEAHRIGKENSIYLFSFLDWNSKIYNPFLSILVNFFRILRNEKTSKYQLPWLNIGGRFNRKFLNRNQPQNSWFKEKHVRDLLEKSNFSVIEIKSKMSDLDKVGHIHVVCKKR